MLSKSKLKYIQTLGQKKFRQQEHCFLAEGPKIVNEIAAAKPGSVIEVFAVDDWIKANTAIVNGLETTVVSEQELEKISQLSTPNKVLAIVKQFDHGDHISTKDKLVLALDDIHDPGNLGTIIRIADWFGVEQVICSNESAEVYNPKVVQATMGSIARVKVFYKDLQQWLNGLKDVRIYATTLEGQDVSKIKNIAEGVVLIGNESKGIDPALISLSNVKITIPKKGKAESLNAAVATGIVLSHFC